MRRHINGSKSRKCTLPYELLTTSERKALNGEVKTYNLNQPIAWPELKTMPEDIQQKYLLHLRETFDASDIMIGQVLGLGRSTVVNLRKTLGVPGRNRSKRVAKEQMEAFQVFLGGETEADEVIEEPVPEPETPQEEPVAAKAQIQTGLQSITFAGETEVVEAYLTELGLVAKNLMPGRVKVTVTVEEVID